MNTIPLIFTQASCIALIIMLAGGEFCMLERAPGRPITPLSIGLRLFLNVALAAALLLGATAALAIRVLALSSGG